MNPVCAIYFSAEKVTDLFNRGDEDESTESPQEFQPNQLLNEDTVISVVEGPVTIHRSNMLGMNASGICKVFLIGMPCPE